MPIWNKNMKRVHARSNPRWLRPRPRPWLARPGPWPISPLLTVLKARPRPRTNVPGSSPSAEEYKRSYSEAPFQFDTMGLSSVLPAPSGIRLSRKGSVTLYHNTICTSAHNKLKLWGNMDISVHSPPYFGKTIPPSLGLMPLDGAENWKAHLEKSAADTFRDVTLQCRRTGV